MGPLILLNKRRKVDIDSRISFTIVKLISKVKIQEWQEGKVAWVFSWLTSVTRNAVTLSARWMHGDSHTTRPLDGRQEPSVAPEQEDRLQTLDVTGTWKHGACGKPKLEKKNFQLHPILRHFWISLKPCYHVDIEKPMVILKTSGRCNRIHKSRIHFFPSPNIAEAGGLSSSGEIC